MMDAGHIFGRLEGPGLCFMSTDPSTANRPLWRQGTALFAGRRCAVGRWAGCCRALKMKTGDPATHTQWLGRSDHGGVASNLPQYTGRSAAPKSTRPRVMRRSIAAKFMLWLRQWGSMVNPNPSLLPTYTLGTRRDKKKRQKTFRQGASRHTARPMPSCRSCPRQVISRCAHRITWKLLHSNYRICTQILNQARTRWVPGMRTVTKEATAITICLPIPAPSMLCSSAAQ